MENIKKLAALQGCENLANELEAVETPEQLQELFHNHGVDLTMEEICAMAEEASARNTDELSDAELDNVAGGGIGGWIVEQICTWFGKKGLDWIYNKVTGKKK